jgi:hypothetical protein
MTCFARISLRFLVGFWLAAAAFTALAQPSFGTNQAFRGVATFHSLSLYWSPPNKGTGQIAQVEYKLAGAPDTTYQHGLDLWYDLRTPAPSGGTAGEYRGSLVHLQPDTAYDIRLTLSPHGYQQVISAQTTCGTADSCTKTWSETFPATGPDVDINTIITVLPNGYRRLTLTAAHSGTAQNWKVYTAPAGSNEINQSSFDPPAGQDAARPMRSGFPEPAITSSSRTTSSAAGGASTSTKTTRTAAPACSATSRARTSRPMRRR